MSEVEDSGDPPPWTPPPHHLRNFIKTGNRMEYISLKSILVVREHWNKPPSVLASTEGATTAILNYTFDTLRLKLPELLEFQSSMVVGEAGGLVDIRNTMTKPKPGSRFLRILIDPKAVYRVADGGRGTCEIFLSTDGVRSVAVMMPVDEVVALLDLAT